jgi:ABC-type sugar transport system permease subunit
MFERVCEVTRGWERQNVSLVFTLFIFLFTALSSERVLSRFLASSWKQRVTESSRWTLVLVFSKALQTCLKAVLVRQNFGWPKGRSAFHVPWFLSSVFWSNAFVNLLSQQTLPLRCIARSLKRLLLDLTLLETTRFFRPLIRVRVPR